MREQPRGECPCEACSCVERQQLTAAPPGPSLHIDSEGDRSVVSVHPAASCRVIHLRSCGLRPTILSQLAGSRRCRQEIESLGTTDGTTVRNLLRLLEHFRDLLILDRHVRATIGILTACKWPAKRPSLARYRDVRTTFPPDRSGSSVSGRQASKGVVEPCVGSGSQVSEDRGEW